MPARSDDPEREDFATLLARFEREQEAPARAAPKIGDRVEGEIVSLGEETAFVDLGGKSEGMVALDELRDEQGELTVAVGDRIEAVVAASDRETGGLLLRVRPGRSGTGGEEAWAELSQAAEHRIPVEGRVTGVNKGGVDVEVSGVRAFCPISQLELGYVADPAAYVGRRLTFRITRCERGRGRRPDVVLSRRDLLAEEAAARAAEARARLEVGKVVRGTVTALSSYGAFVDLGGVEGLLHVSEISHRRVADPAEALAVGQALEVEVLRIEPPKAPGGAERISLSLRSLEPDPWRSAAERFAEGAVVAGRVARLESFGAFVELAPGIDGLVHVSELGAGRRVDHPRQAVAVGQEVTVTVLAVDPERRRISLSMAAPGTAGAAAEDGGGAGDAPSPPRRESGGLGTLGDFFDPAAAPGRPHRGRGKR
jgi:small subunit ribosomal protein S1